jgi:ArsR family transcriptional regulator, arsenate/arsenite/antimonite-responsive transcriptional repressor
MSITIDILRYVHYIGRMDIQKALIAFDALSQETRLKAFRMLVEEGPEGAPAGKLSEKLGIPHNTLSFHLNHMSNADLVSFRKEGRSVIYTANFAFVQELIRFMVENCCNVDFASVRTDNKRGCEIIELANCCSPKSRRKS